MSMRFRGFVSLLWFAVSMLAIARPAVADGGAERPVVVVTTSALGEAARGLLGDSQARVVEIVPPGACPGHFDMSPRMLPDLRAAHLVVRHDYQAGLDGGMRSVAGDGLHIVSVPSSGTLLMPSEFARVQTRVAQVLEAALPDLGDELRARLASQREALGGLERELLSDARALRGRRAVVSAMQADFCRRLGIDVVATIARPEDVTPRQVERLAAARADFVVANLQSGVRAAQTVARRMGVETVVLSNFPRAEGFGDDYADLVRENMRRLVAACPKR